MRRRTAGYPRYSAKNTSVCRFYAAASTPAFQAAAAATAAAAAATAAASATSATATSKLFSI